MILGIGTDIVNIERIEKDLERFGEKFEKRLFTQNEIDLANARAKSGEHAKAATLAKRFAAKEAFVKALGSGFTGGISWQEMEVSLQPGGKPVIQAYGKTLALLKALSPRSPMPRVDLSMADDYPFAQAFVVISFG